MISKTNEVMWPELENIFDNKPSQLKVVNLLLEHGFRIEMVGEKPKIFAGEIELPISKVSNAAGVDRKVVDTTISEIMANAPLYAIFSRLKPVADISEVTRHAKNTEDGNLLKNFIGEGVIEIYALSESVGIASLATKLLADEGLSIQFMLAKDPKLSVESTMIIVTDKSIPGKVVDRLLKNKNIIKVSLS